MATAKESRIREGLAKAALHPEGLPIQSHRTTNGLFTSSKEGREAQETCLKSGWLEMSADSSEARITTLAWNHLASDPRLDLVFSELLRQIDSWRDQDRLLVQRVREHLSRLDHLRETVNLLTQPQKASPQLPIESHLQHLSKRVHVPDFDSCTFCKTHRSARTSDDRQSVKEHCQWRNFCLLSLPPLSIPLVSWVSTSFWR